MGCQTAARPISEAKIKIAEQTKEGRSARSSPNATSALTWPRQARAEREQATQYANVVVPAENEKQRIETLAETEAERIRRVKKGRLTGSAP